MPFGISNKFAAGAAVLAISALVISAPAEAGCKKLGFTVNHYGKEGPTRDAKALLDKYVATWTAEHGIKKYRMSKKEVSCYQFLDFGFFDEWTCKAVSNVCFSGKVPGGKAEAKKDKRDPKRKAATKKTAKKSVKKVADKTEPKKAEEKKAQ